MTTDIIIPTHNLPEMTVACLNSIRRHTSDYQVIWVDNGSSEAAKGQVRDVLADMPHRAIMLDSNQGFIRATNAGICASDAAHVCLLNNDTEVEPAWLERMLSVYQDDPQIGLVGPTTTGPEWQNREKVLRQIRGILPPWLLVHTMLAFFCVVLSREVLDKVGLLSEEYGVGFGDDDDYCRRVEQAGFRMALALDVMIKHHHRTTFRSLYSDHEIRQMQRAALTRYSQHWGPYPQALMR
jgi:GT2 family glycosyltransferase